MAQEIADSTLLDTWGSGGNIVEPDISKIIEGWQLGEQPPHEYMNWLQNTFGSKLNHILKNGVASWNNETEYLSGASVQYNGNVWLCKTTNTNSEPTDANSNWKRIITVESLTTVLGGYVALTGNQTIAGIKTFSDNVIIDGVNGKGLFFRPQFPIETQPSITTDGLDELYVNSFDNLYLRINAVNKLQITSTAAIFSVFPVTPNSAPTTDYQVANKKYVDDNSEATWVANDNRAKTALNATGTAPIYACRAWVNFNGTGTVAIRASGNVSSITDNGLGDYTVNFTTSMSDVNYSTLCTGVKIPLGGARYIGNDYINSSANGSRVYAWNGTNAEDMPHISVSIFR